MKTSLIFINCFVVLHLPAMEIVDIKDDPKHPIEQRIHYAVRRNDLDILRDLIPMQDALVNALYNGYTPLQTACEYEKRNAVSILLFRGADLTIEKADGSTALSIAELKNNKNIIELLKTYSEKAPTYATNTNFNSASKNDGKQET